MDLLIGPSRYFRNQITCLKKRERSLCQYDAPVTCHLFWSLLKLQPIEACHWMDFCFVSNCQNHTNQSSLTSSLSTQELLEVDRYCYFLSEMQSLSRKGELSSSSPLLSLNPFVNSSGLLCVGCRQQLSKSTYESKHPVILLGKHPLTQLIRTEHLCLLHAGPTFLFASLSQRYIYCWWS